MEREKTKIYLKRKSDGLWYRIEHGKKVSVQTAEAILVKWDKKQEGKLQKRSN